MLSGVTVSCFLLSYAVVLVMEVSRTLWKVPSRDWLLVVMMLAGLIAHSIFLANQFWLSAFEGSQPQLLANWFQWSVLSAWGLAIACLLLMVRNPNGSVGLFLIPMVLVLIGLAQLVRGMPPFRPESTIGMWRAIHGISLLLGTMFICFGLTFGAMYLVQSHRLKHKKRPSQRIKLPTLEFLQSMNRLSLFASALGLAVGAISGIVLSFNREGHIDWFSGGIVFTFALFVWLFVAAIMELTATGSLGGRRSAYLVIANFLFLVVVLGLVLVSSHGRQAKLENSVRELDEYLHNRLQNGLVAIAHEAVTNDLPRAEARL